jgi:peptide/nickel transport system permease protein
VRDLIADRVGNTAILGATALAVATLIGLPLGVLAGSRRGWLPSLVRALSIAVLSVPPLVCALALAFLAARTGWFPVGGLPTPAPGGWGLQNIAHFAWHLTLPTLALAVPFAATIEQLQAQAMAAALTEPYIVAARGRGVTPARLVWRHGLRSAIRPVASIYGIIIGTLFSGSFAVEVVTSWPGLGLLMRDALVSRDLYLVAGCAAAGAIFLAAGGVVADLVLVAADPRLREEGS